MFSSTAKLRAQFTTMLSPLPLANGVTLRNRIVMGSMHTGLEESKEAPYERMAEYFSERAKGGVGLIVTGGVAPNFEGKVHPWAGKLTSSSEAKKYRVVTDAVHKDGGKIIMQILHTGRYAYSPLAFAPSSVPAPIWPFHPPLRPIAMPQFMINKTIRDYARCARLAAEAGFDGVEVMGSEGYLLNEFLVTHTNKRKDKYGGSFENRMRFPLEVLEAVRNAVSKEFIIVYRVSMLDLVPNGSTKEEVHLFAEKVAERADIISTGIGWHEARVPTIVTSVPRAAFTWVTKKCREHLRAKNITTPLITTNRINSPQVAEAVLEEGAADLISMARPLLADPYFVQKAAAGRQDEINTCIACNQACLDHSFKMKICSCLVNPIACSEKALTPTAAKNSKKVAVVGAGPGGLWCSITLAQRGHQVTLYEQSDVIGGQFNIAKLIPGKEEFNNSIAYWKTMLNKYKDNITVKLQTTATVDELVKTKYDDVVVATGAAPRPTSNRDIDGIEGNPSVVSYKDVITGKVKVGEKVIIIGAGGIGFDTAVFLTHEQHSNTNNNSNSSSSNNEENNNNKNNNSEKGYSTARIEAFCNEWGVDQSLSGAGFLTKPKLHRTSKTVTMMQRKTGKQGKGLGPTSGWVHRLSVRAQGVQQYSGVTYIRTTPNKELVVRIKDNNNNKNKNNKNNNNEGGEEKHIPFDTIVLCHGQVSKRELVAPLVAQIGEAHVHIIGGAKDPSELDAKRAIREGHEVALKI